MTIYDITPVVAEATNTIVAPLTEIIDKNHCLFEGHEVEMVELNGEILFNANDVAELLGIKNIRENLRKMNDNQVVKLTNSDVRDTDIRKMNNKGENFLTESGLYKLAFRSNKESAERFTDWVTDEVIPQIRKTGGYIPHDEDMSDDEIMARALIVAQNTIAEKSKKLDLAEKENLKLTSIIESQKPKLEYLDEILSCDDALLVTTIAFDYGLSAVALNRILEEERIQRKVRGQWVLYSKYLGKGYTKTETKMIGDKTLTQSIKDGDIGGGNGALIFDAKSEHTGSGEIQEDNLADIGKSLKVTSDTTSIIAYFKTDKIKLGKYGIAIRAKTNNNTLGKNILKVEVLKISKTDEETNIKTIEFKGTNFEKNNNYCWLTSFFDYALAKSDGDKLGIKISTAESMGESITLELDYVSILPLMSAQYVMG